MVKFVLSCSWKPVLVSYSLDQDDGKYTHWIVKAAMKEIKLFPNNDRYLSVLRAMTPEQKLRKVFELNEMGRELCRAGLRQRHPDADDQTIQQMLVKKMSACHNENY